MSPLTVDSKAPLVRTLFSAQRRVPSSRRLPEYPGGLLRGADPMLMGAIHQALTLVCAYAPDRMLDAVLVLLNDDAVGTLPKKLQRPGCADYSHAQLIAEVMDTVFQSPTIIGFLHRRAELMMSFNTGPVAARFLAALTRAVSLIAEKHRQAHTAAAGLTRVGGRQRT